MKRKTKTYRGTIALKEDSDQTGEFSAVFATLNVIDHDGDVTVPGAFQDGQKVRVASWGHKWQELPVGRGVIHADAERAWVDGRFFLDTDGGRETYKTVKALEELQEWSYGFDILKRSFGQFAGQDVQFLEAMEVHEVSPVLLGAGIGTQTTAIKGAKDSASDDAEDEDGGQNESGSDADGVAPSGPPPQVVLTQIDIELTEG